ncbi:MAG: SepZ protein [Thermoprotei archaeon]
MPVSKARRALGGVIIALGVIGWVFAIFMVLGQEYTLLENYFAWSLVPISGAVVVLGGLLAGLWG